MKPQSRFVSDQSLHFTLREYRQFSLAKREITGIVTHAARITAPQKGIMSKLPKALRPMFITCFLAGIVLAVLAPFGTQNFATPYRFLYWIGLCFAGGLGAGLVNTIAHWRGLDLNPWVAALAQSITSTLAVASVILIMMAQTYGLPNAGGIAQLMFYIWVVGITISSIGALIRTRNLEPATAPNRAAIYERLAPKLRSAEIYALAAEDHYVRVITSKGDDLILMRLSDAIKEIAPLKGLSPHRSWWVAEGGAQTIKKSEIILPQGQPVPISRSGMKLVRAAGWV